MKGHSLKQKKMKELRDSETDGMFTPASFTRDYTPQKISRVSVFDRPAKGSSYSISKNASIHRSSPDLSSKKVASGIKNMNSTRKIEPKCVQNAKVKAARGLQFKP